MNKKHALDFIAIKRLNTYIKNNNINIIHAHSTSFFTGTLVKISNRKVKLIWHDHYGNSHFLNERPLKVLRWCSTKFEAIICVNETLKQWAKQNLKCKNVSFFNNFVTINNNEKKQTNLKGNEGKRVVCLANLRPQKDHFMLLDAFKEVVKLDDEWTLHLVGNDNKDSYSFAIKEKINTLKLNDNIFVYGSKSDVYHILKQSDIGVLSSKSEGLPLALLEYGLAKLPVVATSVGDCSKVITKVEEGILVESGDYKAFSKAIQGYINNKDLRQLKGEALYKNVEANFSDKFVKKQLKEIYTN